MAESAWQSWLEGMLARKLDPKRTGRLKRPFAAVG
jgi:hypothetical protein